MAAAEMKNWCAAMLGAGGLVVVAIGSRMRQVSLGHEMNGALDDLSRAWHHGQRQNQGPDLGATDSHRAEYTLVESVSRRFDVPMGLPKQ